MGTNKMMAIIAALGLMGLMACGLAGCTQSPTGITKSLRDETEDKTNEPIQPSQPTDPATPGESLPTPEETGVKRVELDQNKDGGVIFGLVLVDENSEKSAIFQVGIDANQLVKKPSQISPSFIAIADKKTGQLLSDWQPSGIGNSHIIPGSSQAFSLSVEGAQAEAVMKALPSIEFVFSIKKDTPSITHAIDVEEVCEKHPNAIVNISTNQRGCGNH